MRTPEQLAAEVVEAVRSDPVAYATAVKAGVDVLIEMAWQSTCEGDPAAYGLHVSAPVAAVGPGEEAAQ